MLFRSARVETDLVPGLGIEIARAFGAKGFTVALIARNAVKLDLLVTQLKDEGIEAGSFPADISQPDTVTRAFAQIKERFGRVDVLEFSPADRALGVTSVLDIDRDTLTPQLEFYLHGGIHAIKQVIPDMIEAGSGTILVTNGADAIDPVPFLADINIAAAGLRNWTLNLHKELGPHGIYVAHVAISAWIGGGHPGAEPSAIDQSTDALATLRIMVTIALIATAVLIAALGIAHSILGEKYIIRWLLEHDLPRLFGGTSFTAGTIRFAWHITTVLFLGLAAVLVTVALGAGPAVVVLVIGSTFIVSAALPIWFTRGRHISWVVLLAAGAMCLAAAAAA